MIVQLGFGIKDLLAVFAGITECARKMLALYMLP